MLHFRGERAYLDHPVQLARKVILVGMDILDCLGSLDKKVSLDHQASTVPLVLMDHQDFLEVAQAEILVLLDHKDQEDFLDPQVNLGKMDLMAPKENRGFQDNLEDQGLLDYQERKDPREKRVKRAMLGCQDFLGQLDSGGIEVVLEPQVFLVKKARKESQLL